VAFLLLVIGAAALLAGVVFIALRRAGLRLVGGPRLYLLFVLAAAGAGLDLVSADAVPRDPAGRDSILRDAGLLESSIHEATPECSACLTFDGTAFQTRRLAPPFGIDSRAALVFDDTCNEVLYGKEEHARLAPASLTKMMTALVAVEQVTDLERRVDVQVSASELREKTRSSVMGLEPGMQVSFRDLLYGLMLPSGNDAAIAIAEATAGSVDAFVAMMNARAAELALEDTHFANPHGLDNRGLYSTAYDLVQLARAMMANPVAAEIAGAQGYAVPGTGMNMINGNRLVRTYDGAFGVKIGYTRRAAHTIVVAAERDGRRVFVSVLGSKVPFVDVTSLLDWAFSETARSC
jgi:D-alanyl-D-alanine carboxypeptidase